MGAPRKSALNIHASAYAALAWASTMFALGPLPPAAAVPIRAHAPSAATLAQVEQVVADAAALRVVPRDASPPLVDAAQDTGMVMAIHHGCYGSTSQTSIADKPCTFGDAASRHTLVAFGDSHAAMWLPALNEVGLSAGWRVILFWKGDCGAADVKYWLKAENRPYSECSAWHRWAVTQIKKLRPSVVILTSLVSAHNGYSGSATATLEPSVWRDGLALTLRELKTPTTAEVVLGDLLYDYNSDYPGGPDCLAAHETDVQACSFPAAPNPGLVYHAAEQQAARESGATYIDVAPWFCTHICTALIGNYVVYSDGGHATATYITYLSGVLGDALAPEMREA